MGWLSGAPLVALPVFRRHAFAGPALRLRNVGGSQRDLNCIPSLSSLSSTIRACDVEPHMSGAVILWHEDRGDPQAHAGWVRGVLALEDGLVSWGEDGAIRFWGRDGAPRPAWIAPARIEMVTISNGCLWIGLLGRPHRLTHGGGRAAWDGYV